MNFEHMPELTWRYGYFSVLFGMGVLAGGLIVFFRHKDWV
jgi:magnesium transporter